VKALILVAGLGTRFGSVTADRPKPMFRDFGQHLIPQLLERGASLCGYRADDHVLDIGAPER